MLYISYTRHSSNKQLTNNCAPSKLKAATDFTNFKVNGFKPAYFNKAKTIVGINTGKFKMYLLLLQLPTKDPLVFIILRSIQNVSLIAKVDVALPLMANNKGTPYTIL